MPGPCVMAQRSWDFRLTGRELRGQDVECGDSEDTLGSVHWDITATLRGPWESACWVQVLLGHRPENECSAVVALASCAACLELMSWECTLAHQPSALASQPMLTLLVFPQPLPWMAHHVDEKGHVMTICTPTVSPRASGQNHYRSSVVCIIEDAGSLTEFI